MIAPTINPIGGGPRPRAATQSFSLGRKYAEASSQDQRDPVLGSVLSRMDREMAHGRQRLGRWQNVGNVAGHRSGASQWRVGDCRGVIRWPNSSPRSSEFGTPPAFPRSRLRRSWNGLTPTIVAQGSGRTESRESFAIPKARSGVTWMPPSILESVAFPGVRRSQSCWPSTGAFATA